MLKFLAVLGCSFLCCEAKITEDVIDQKIKGKEWRLPENPDVNWSRFRVTSPIRSSLPTRMSYLTPAGHVWNERHREDPVAI